MGKCMLDIENLIKYHDFYRERTLALLDWGVQEIVEQNSETLERALWLR